MTDEMGSNARKPPAGKPHPGKPYTRLQGQYLAFIYYYTKLNGRPPAERDMEDYFKTAFSSVHQMVLTLQKKGFISRVPGAPRSIALRLPRAQLPDLE